MRARASNPLALVFSMRLVGDPQTCFTVVNCSPAEQPTDGCSHSSPIPQAMEKTMTFRRKLTAGIGLALADGLILTDQIQTVDATPLC